MIDIYLLIGILVSIAITASFTFMVRTNISQNRAVLAERINTDYDFI